MGTIQPIMRKGILPILAILACLAIAACGSSSKPSTTAKVQHPPPVTKASFDAEVGSLCQRANSAFGVAKTHSGQVAVISHYLTVFRSVKVPSQLKATYAKYLGVIAQELAALKRGDKNQVFQLAHSKAKPLARALGAKGCITGS
jgi:hypothetical protein